MTAPFIPPMVRRRRMALPGFQEQAPIMPERRPVLDESRFQQAMEFGDQTDQIDQAMGLNRAQPQGLRRLILPAAEGLAAGLVQNLDEESTGVSGFLRGLGQGFLGQRAMARQDEADAMDRERMAQAMKLRLLGAAQDERRLRLGERQEARMNQPAPVEAPRPYVVGRSLVGADGRLLYRDAETPAAVGGPIRLGEGDVLADPTGKILTRNPRPVEAVAGPKALSMPGAIVQQVEGNNSRMRVIDEALAELDRNAGSVGMQNYAGQTIMQRIDPQGIRLRSAIADIGSMVIHDRSGAAVTVSEFPRLIPFIPQVTDSPAKIRSNLQRMREIIAEETAAYEGRYGRGPTQGVPAGIARPTSQPASKADRWEELVGQGLSPEAAKAQVIQEYGE